jgi:hypothetical protein
VASVEHFGPFIGLNLGPQATHTWSLEPFAKLFDAAASVSAHPWPQPSGSDPRHQPHLAEVAVTSVRSQITAAGERFLVVAVQNMGVLPLDGYDIRVTLTTGAARA